MDEDLHQLIDELTAEVHGLRGAGEKTDETRARLAELGVKIDQTWDLLRQREALRAAGGDASAAHERPEAEVEGYLN